MNLRRMGAVARKEFIHIRRDYRSLILALAIPLLLLSLFGWALSLDVNNVPTAVWDQSGTPESRELLSALDGSPYITITQYVDGYTALTDLINRGDARLAVVVPYNFARLVESGQGATLQVIADGSDANTGALALFYVQGAAQAYGAGVARELAARGLATALPPPFELRPRAWYNPTLRSQNFIIPGLIALIMVVIAALLTSLTVAREWERGTMEQLIATPVRSAELITGKLIPYWVIGMFDVVVAATLGYTVFHVPLRGSPLLVLAASAVFLLGALSMGMLASISFKSQVLASQIALIGTYLPTLFLSGFMFALSNMPLPLQWLSYIVPARYFLELMRSVYLKGAGLSLVGGHLLLLSAFSAAVFALSITRFRKRLA